MGKVLIIKNNNSDSWRYKNALDSYNSKETRYYVPEKGSRNEDYLIENKESFGGNGIILFITYNNVKDTKEKIKDIFIGAEVNIKDDNQITYVMYRYLTYDNNKIAIKSIIEKIDLNLNKDFEQGCYVIISDMESLYDELRDRINAVIPLQENKYYTVKEAKTKNYKQHKFAQKDNQIIRVFPSDEVKDDRTEFQRDRERVVNCKAFRRMVDKAQIFGAEKGDYYRTRMTHTLEVNQIAKAIAYALGLNLDLTEAIALGHDIGHTPFGHQGERTLDDILCGKTNIDMHIDRKLLQDRCYGGFKHNYQSAHILTELEEKYVDFPGLNVSVQVVEGVLKHTRLKEKIIIDDFLKKEYKDIIKLENIHNGKTDKEKVCSATLEGQTVSIADEIAQRGHDVDDALTSGVLSISEFMDLLQTNKCKELRRKLQKDIENVDNSKRLLNDREELKIARIISSIVNYMIVDTIHTSLQKMSEYDDMQEITMDNEIKMVDFSEKMQGINEYLEKVVQRKVICNSEVARADYNADVIVKALFEKYYNNPRLLHKGTLQKVFIETLKHSDKDISNSAVNLGDGNIELINQEIDNLTKKDITNENKVIFEKRKILVRCIVDYIAGMTDGYAIGEYEKLK